MHIKSEKAKKLQKHTLNLTQDLTENRYKPINKTQKVIAGHILIMYAYLIYNRHTLR